MHVNVARRSLGPIAGGLAVALGGAVAALAVSALAGTKTGFVLALMAIGGPIIFYLIVVAPLIFPFGVYVGLVPFDNLLSINAFGTLTKVLGGAAGAALIFYLLRTKKAVRPSPTLLIWGALYVWAAITAFWAYDQTLVFTGLLTSTLLVLLYLAISIFPADQNALRCVTLAIIIGSVAAAIYGAYLFHNGVNIYYGSRLRITSDTGAIDPNHFAAAMLLPIALCLSSLLHTRKGLVAIASIAALALLFVGVALSGSRGAVVAILCMLVYFLIRDRAKVRLIAMGVATTIMAALFSANTDLWNRFSTAVSTGGNGRTSIWRVGLQALKSHWLFGAGYGNFPNAYDHAFLQTSHQLWGAANWHRASHDLLIGTSVELGVIGLALLLAGWAAQFFILRDITPSEPEYPLRVAGEAAVVGIFIAALFLDVMSFKYVWLAFMFIAILRNVHRNRIRGLSHA
ncbi:MAG TPA: O-antigen ligase family protein [Candidatus Baltobacteraceae bacterium]|jgi:O-antigen ligase